MEGPAATARGAGADLLEQARRRAPGGSAWPGRRWAAAQEGSQVARAEFLPRHLRPGPSRDTPTGGNVITGWQEGAGPARGGPTLRWAAGTAASCGRPEADVEAAPRGRPDHPWDAISLQVNLAYRGVVAANGAASTWRGPPSVQAEENLRLIRVRYRNGDATPTDIVDSEARRSPGSQQRFFSATYTYLAALARLDYAGGAAAGWPVAGRDEIDGVSDNDRRVIVCAPLLRRLGDDVDGGRCAPSRDDRTEVRAVGARPWGSSSSCR